MTRIRKIATDDQRAKAEVPAEARQLIREVYLHNKAKNAATSAENKARKELLGLMENSSVSHYQIVTEFSDVKLTLEAKVETPDKEVIDVHALRKIVGEEQFMQIVSATKTAIAEVAGKHVLAQVTKVIPQGGTTNVKVGVVK